MTKQFYDIPVQVRFLNFDGSWHAGIAYQDVIICGCCGSVFKIKDILDNMSAAAAEPIAEYSDWADLTNEIVGDGPIDPSEDEDFNEEAWQDGEWYAAEFDASPYDD